MNRKLRRQLAKKLKESTMERLQEYRTELETWADKDLETAGPRQAKRYRVALALTQEEISRREPRAITMPVITDRKPRPAREPIHAGPTPFQVLGYRI